MGVISSQPKHKGKLMYAYSVGVDDIPYLDRAEMLGVAVVVYSWVAVVNFKEFFAFQLNHIGRLKCPPKVRMILSLIHI